MAPDNEFQTAVFQLLMGSTDLQSLIFGRVYDGEFEGDTLYPYVSFGPSDSVPDDTDCRDAERYTLQIDTWSDEQGQKEIKAVMFAVRQALHNQAVDLPTHAMHDMRVVNSQVLPDPKGVHHGVQQIEVDIEIAD